MRKVLISRDLAVMRLSLQQKRRYTKAFIAMESQLSILIRPWVKQWLEVINDRDFLSFSITNQNANLFAKDIEDSGNGCFTFTLCLSSCLSLSDGEQVLTHKNSRITFS